eukprot:4821425-Ditylum_brightwellii.AAC.1
MPGPGPDGPNTLCPDCCRSYKAEMKLAAGSSTVPDEREKTEPIPAVTERGMDKYSGGTVDERADENACK